MSGIKYLIDTCTLIALQKRTPESLALLSNHQAVISECAISLITYIEFVGFYRADPYTVSQLSTIANGFICLPISQPITQKTIQLRINNKIKLPDCIVLAAALTHHLQLLTLDNGLHKKYLTETTDASI